MNVIRPAVINSSWSCENVTAVSERGGNTRNARGPRTLYRNLKSGPPRPRLCGVLGARLAYTARFPRIRCRPRVSVVFQSECVERMRHDNRTSHAVSKRSLALFNVNFTVELAVAHELPDGGYSRRVVRPRGCHDSHSVSFCTVSIHNAHRRRTFLAILKSNSRFVSDDRPVKNKIVIRIY